MLEWTNDLDSLSSKAMFLDGVDHNSLFALYSFFNVAPPLWHWLVSSGNSINID